MLLHGGGAATTSKPVTLPKGRYQGLSQQGVFLAPWAMKIFFFGKTPYLLVRIF